MTQDQTPSQPGALLPCPSNEPIFSHLITMSYTKRYIVDGKTHLLDAYWVECNCGFRGPESGTPEDAEAAWSRRPSLRTEAPPDLEDSEVMWCTKCRREFEGRDVGLCNKSCPPPIPLFAHPSPSNTGMAPAVGTVNIHSWLGALDRLAERCGFPKVENVTQFLNVVGNKVERLEKVEAEYLRSPTVTGLTPQEEELVKRAEIPDTLMFYPSEKNAMAAIVRRLSVSTAGAGFTAGEIEILVDAQRKMIEKYAIAYGAMDITPLSPEHIRALLSAPTKDQA